MNRRPVLAALASLAVAPLSLPVLAQSYPSKPVRVVVPFALATQVFKKRGVL